MPKVPKGSKYRAVGEEVPFGGELGIVQKSKNVPNFSKQGEAIGKTRGRKQTKEAKAKAEPKKKSRRGQEPAGESKPKRQRRGAKETI